MTFDPMWDNRFAETEYAYGIEPNDFLKQHINQLKPGTVLTLAEGEGRNAVYLAKQGFTVTAIDASIKGLEKAQNLAKQHNVKIDYLLADLASHNLGELKWDNVISIFSPFGSKLRKPLHKQVLQSLKPNGVLLLEAYTPDQIQYGTGGGNDPDTMMTTQDVRNEFLGLEFSTLQVLERKVIEGQYHNGLASVVQAIGTKYVTK